MTEIEQLRADLATLEAAQETINQIGKNRYTSNYWVEFAIVTDLKKRIADLEAQQAPKDEWADSRMFVQEILADSSFPQRLIWLARYAKHLQAKIAELEEEIGANESEAYLGDFRVLKTAQDIAKYAGSNDIPSCQKAFCRNLINSINDFTLYVRLWEGLHSLAPYKWSSVGLHDKHLINKKECDK